MNAMLSRTPAAQQVFWEDGALFFSLLDSESLTNINKEMSI